ncbi:MAG TPA: glycerol-3-phosphate 1-O-acyltransferase PlsY [Coxiellaceae bacterium]|nr:glycerol-3-phosphate 1-O-acyltransferase PlsY [Coxiellaceae bacterium]
MSIIICLILAYLIGSLSMGIILSKFMDFPDPRTEGSGNAGATNVLRISTKNKALMVLLGDGLKGFVAVLIAHMMRVEGFALSLVAIAAVAGHIFPLYFKFKGGKGVATALGTLFGLNIIVGLLATVTWGAIAFISKYSSLASMVTMIVAPVYIVIFSSGTYLIPTVAMAVLVLWRHLDNFQRLKSGTEDKISFNKVHMDGNIKSAVEKIQQKSTSVIQDIQKKGEDLLKKQGNNKSNDDKKS